LAIGEAKIASLERVTSLDEVTVLALPLEANLVLPCRVFSASEVRRASLLALSHALPLASWQSMLELGAESDARSETLLARTGALVLASHAAVLTPPKSVIEASGAAVASL